MIKIGIVAPKNYQAIAKTLLNLFEINNISCAVEKNSKNIESKLDFLEKNGVLYTITIFNYKLIYPVLLDILIIDNAPNGRIITSALAECVGENTILIYNTDNGYLPKLEHKNAIDYGFSPNSSVTVSSIEYFPDSKAFVMCIQRALPRLFSDDIEIGEIPVCPINNRDIESQLPAVIAALLCSVPISSRKSSDNRLHLHKKS